MTPGYLLLFRVGDLVKSGPGGGDFMGRLWQVFCGYCHSLSPGDSRSILLWELWSPFFFWLMKLLDLSLLFRGS